MPEIRQLSPHVADMIAAGEVVERPASVVKELIENAADAGATVITLEIRRGGMSYIRVTDNGCGMSPKDARTAFLRHATSKLRDERGLEAIGTLGFRGEALAAISAVSRIELLTREAEASEGTRLVLEAGSVVEEAPVGCPVGTTMIVRDLFYNTPARQKFMKSDRAETGAVTAAATHFALSRPAVSLRYIRDGQEEFHTPGDGKDSSAVYTLLGRDMAAGMLKVKGEANGVKVSGFASAPYAARGNRTMQLFFVNGRFVKSRTLQAALEQAYRNQLFTGKFPACVLYIDLSLAAVDVNVHPAKTEVRFLREKEVFDAVYYSVLGALNNQTETAQVEISPATKSAIGKPIVQPAAPAAKPAPPAAASAHVAPVPLVTKPAAPAAHSSPVQTGRVTATSGGFKTVKAGQPNPFSRGGFGAVTLGDSGRAKFNANLGAQTAIPMPSPKTESTAAPMPKPKLENGAAPVPTPKAAAPAPTLVSTPPAPKTAEAELMQQELPPTQPDWRIVGEALGTYIIVEQGDKLILIDKHAAHERVIFDRLMANKEPVMTQPMLTPLILTMTPEDTALILDNTELMTQYGFEVDAFGRDSIALRAVPTDVDLADAEGTLEMIAGEIRSNSADPNAARDAILHTVACKAAIKAGRRSDPMEHKAVADAVMSGRVRYCPHGRPVSVTLTKYELDRQFKRV